MCFHSAALHDLDPVFQAFSGSDQVKELLTDLGYKRPMPIQSTFIFKVMPLVLARQQLSGAQQWVPSPLALTPPLTLRCSNRRLGARSQCTRTARSCTQTRPPSWACGSHWRMPPRRMAASGPSQVHNHHHPHDLVVYHAIGGIKINSTFLFL